MSDRWVRGRPVSAAELAAAFAPVQMPRRVDRHGYVRFRRRRLYGNAVWPGGPWQFG